MRRSNRPLLTAASALLAGCLVLTGCSGDEAGDGTNGTGQTENGTEDRADDEPDVEPEPAEPEDTEPEADTEDDETNDEGGDAGSDGEGSGDEAPPGTALGLGATATVPVVYGDAEGVVSVTVELEAGAASDLDELELDDAEGMVPYYGKFVFTKVDGGELARANLVSDFATLTAVGTPGSTLIAVGWDRCRSSSAPAEFDAGESFETCRAWVAPEGTDITSVIYRGASDSPYRDDPVTWGG